ncbi:zinc-binding dehydrogenase [Hoyosella sp. YIM 151337]|uniref:quinone oxidoreductase family protein n=1 Tax=Hoyosella sp. YIM 151337 TaxID=2992742 RepID=UPI002235D989|nr:zinc-binding dehydrogenase [Hoyosella sp. YIM 151337]MCW4354693.1 zinc-binding dehydrogenase [Hoyosella sp. YIM 151337]
MPPEQTMRALVHAGTPGPDGLRILNVPTPKPAADEVLIKVLAAGLNRHELFVINSHDDDQPRIVGADAVGTVCTTGADADPDVVGHTVLINPCLGWDNTEDVPEVPTILGGPIQGTFAEYVCVPARNVHAIPQHLSLAEAAALPLAALTAYRALFTQGHVKSGDHVVITGATGGAGVIALAMAAAVGAEVTVITRHTSKAAQAKAIGAAHVVAGTNDFHTELHAPADVVLDSVGADTFAAAVSSVRPGGRVVSFGATSTPDVDLSLRDLFFRQISIQGTSMGSAPEFEKMIEFVTRHRIAPIVHAVCPLEKAPDAFRDMAVGSGFGKTVFTIGDGQLAR